jgi:hypothetical protein
MGEPWPGEALAWAAAPATCQRRAEAGKRERPLAAAYFPHPVARAVSSALRRFTSVFGMGTGGSTSLWPPGTLVLLR